MWARYRGVLGPTDKPQINLLVHQNRWMAISSIRTVNTMPNDYAGAKAAFLHPHKLQLRKQFMHALIDITLPFKYVSPDRWDNYL